MYVYEIKLLVYVWDLDVPVAVFKKQFDIWNYLEKLCW